MEMQLSTLIAYTEGVDKEMSL